jgi:TRAP-type C4-dicarboxylate transport system permease small subunit
VLDRLEKFSHRLSDWFEHIGVAAIMVIVAITCVDVVGAKLFLRPVRGAIDIVMLCQLVAVSFACAMTLISGRHVRVEFLVARLPRRGQLAINTAISFLGLALFALIIWRLCVYGHSFQTYGEYTPTAHIPLYPFAYGVALANIPVCLVFLLEFLNSLTKLVKR